MEKLTKFKDKSVTMKKMVLSDANTIIIPVMNSIFKYTLGEADVFLHFKIQDFEQIQKLLCKYVSWTDTNSSLTLFDISDNLDEFMGLSIEFLEYNFGFFSQSRKIHQRLANGQTSELKETN